MKPTIQNVKTLQCRIDSNGIWENKHPKIDKNEKYILCIEVDISYYQENNYEYKTIYEYNGVTEYIRELTGADRPNIIGVKINTPYILKPISIALGDREIEIFDLNSNYHNDHKKYDDPKYFLHSNCYAIESFIEKHKVQYLVLHDFTTMIPDEKVVHCNKTQISLLVEKLEKLGESDRELSKLFNWPDNGEKQAPLDKMGLLRLQMEDVYLDQHKNIKIQSLVVGDYHYQGRGICYLDPDYYPGYQKLRMKIIPDVDSYVPQLNQDDFYVLGIQSFNRLDIIQYEELDKYIEMLLNFNDNLVGIVVGNGSVNLLSIISKALGDKKIDILRLKDNDFINDLDKCMLIKKFINKHGVVSFQGGMYYHTAKITDDLISYMNTIFQHQIKEQKSEEEFFEPKRKRIKKSEEKDCKPVDELSQSPSKMINNSSIIQDDQIKCNIAFEIGGSDGRYVISGINKLDKNKPYNLNVSYLYFCNEMSSYINMIIKIIVLYNNNINELEVDTYHSSLLEDISNGFKGITIKKCRFSYADDLDDRESYWEQEVSCIKKFQKDHAVLDIQLISETDVVLLHFDKTHLEKGYTDDFIS